MTMKTYIYSALVAALTLTSHAVASRLTNVSLTFENGSTVAKIDIEGQIRFTHQTEIPKNGKPDRMILDVIGVTNDFETKSFSQLPVCGVTGIRTSQYAVTPEKVVRLVFDMTKAPVYRVESDHSSIRVIFTDNTIKPFATWTAITKGISRSSEPKPTPKPIAVTDKGTPPAHATTPAAIVTTQNKNIEQDRQSSLASKGTPSVAPQALKAPTPVAADKPKSEMTTPVSADSKSAPAKSLSTTTASKPTVAVAPSSTVTPSQAKTAPAPSPDKPKRDEANQSKAPTSTIAEKPKSETTVPVTADSKAAPAKSPSTTIASKPTVAAAPNSTVTPSQTKSAPAASAPDKPKGDVATQSKIESKPTTTSSPTIVSAPAPKSVSSPLAQNQTTPTQPKVEYTSNSDDEEEKAVPSSKPNSGSLQPGTGNVTKPATGGSPAVASAPTAVSQAQPTTPSPIVVQNPQPKVSVTYTPDKPKTDDKVESNQPTTPTIATNMTGKSSEKNPEPPKPTTAINTPSVTGSTSLPLVGPQPAPGPNQTSSTSAPIVAKNDSSSRSSAEEIAATEEGMSDTIAEKTTPVADQTTALTPADTTTSTSRFRRSPELSSKIKGTMIAEFPKRLVIKYDPGPNRDPFATLADNTRTYDSPVETRIPNVEGLKLVGIIQSNSGDNRALFEDKKNYSYILKSGDRVLRGNVLRVESDRVYFQIFEYGWSRTIALTIDDNFGR